MIKRILRAAHYALIHFYAITGLMILTYMAGDARDFHKAAYIMLDIGTDSLIAIQSSLRGMTL